MRRPGVGDALVRRGASVREVLEVITKNGKQVAVVIDTAGRLQGLVTDGDIRKGILRGVGLEAPVDEVMNRDPVVGTRGVPAADALGIMRAHSIRQLPLLDASGIVTDLLLLDDLLEPAPMLPNRAVIMAGGEGRRLLPITESIPKPLVTVGGQPIVEILIERLRQSGIVDVVVAVHHKSAMIRERLRDGARLGVRIEYVEEQAPLGTMGALTLLRDRLVVPFFVVNADILTKCDFRAMLEFHQAQAGAALTVGVSLHQVEIPYGEFTLRGTRVTQLEEKPRKEFPVNAGIYIMEPAVIELLPVGQVVDATDVIRALLARGQVVSAYHLREYWLDVGHHLDLEKANHDVIQGLLE